MPEPIVRAVNDHYPIFKQSKTRCRYCNDLYTTCWCSECNVALCLLSIRNCFERYHTRFNDFNLNPRLRRLLRDHDRDHRRLLHFNYYNMYAITNESDVYRKLLEPHQLAKQSEQLVQLSENFGWWETQGKEEGLDSSSSDLEQQESMEIIQLALPFQLNSDGVSQEFGRPENVCHVSSPRQPEQDDCSDTKSEELEVLLRQISECTSENLEMIGETATFQDQTAFFSELLAPENASIAQSSDHFQKKRTEFLQPSENQTHPSDPLSTSTKVSGVEMKNMGDTLLQIHEIDGLITSCQNVYLNCNEKRPQHNLKLKRHKKLKYDVRNIIKSSFFTKAKNRKKRKAQSFFKRSKVKRVVIGKRVQQVYLVLENTQRRILESQAYQTLSSNIQFGSESQPFQKLAQSNLPYGHSAYDWHISTPNSQPNSNCNQLIFDQDCSLGQPILDQDQVSGYQNSLPEFQRTFIQGQPTCEQRGLPNFAQTFQRFPPFNHPFLTSLTEQTVNTSNNDTINPNLHNFPHICENILPSNFNSIQQRQLCENRSVLENCLQNFPQNVKFSSLSGQSLQDNDLILEDSAFDSNQMDWMMPYLVR